MCKEVKYEMSRARLEEILERIGSVRAGLIGDLCLDVYWHADMRKSELSRETPHYPLPVIKERMSLGGGANAAANIAALSPKQAEVFGVVGSDWRGRELVRLMEGQGIGFSGIAVDQGRLTNAYIKPIRKGHSDVEYEDPRIDFASYTLIDAEIEDKLIAELDKAAMVLDILCVSDQLPFGVITERVRGHICELAHRGLRVVADSRYNIDFFSGCILKPNEIEGARATGVDPESLSDIKACSEAASILSGKTGSDVFMTLGAKGSLCLVGGQLWHISSHEISGPIDFCGAGDSALSGFGLSLAAGAMPWEAAYVAGLCSEVTIRQIGVTGTASREQVLQWHNELSVHT